MYANSVARSARQNSQRAQQIINELAEEKADALNSRDTWKVHYLALETERDYLLELLDEKCGGSENNPAREIASDSIRIPNGPREGDLIQMRDRIYLTALKGFIAEKASYLGSWKEVIRICGIFK